MTTTTTASIVQEPAVDYHANVSHVSRGMLNDFKYRRRLYQKKYILNAIPEEPPTDAMELGTLCHAVLLEGKPLDSLVEIIPASALNLDGHRKGPNWTAFKNAADPSKIHYTAREAAESMAMVNSVLNHPAVGQWHNAASHREASIYWEQDGINLRCRPDWIVESRGELIAIDLKTARDASEDGMDRAIRSAYAFQQAHYSPGIEAAFGVPIAAFLFVAVDSKPPYTTYVHGVGHEAMKHATEDWKQTIKNLKACIETDDWSDGENEIIWHDFTREEYQRAKGW